ncbi:DUF4132 domain-containing protein [Saccharothrix obliqua]|uniref:DUF4132 domain-containing protein n=1 Tax=Saccharothrix obliqua TaxID=2861747 RepID=UPI001C5DD88C|nr:DUF4132 domain-containing protein [Saccharothrix obliqua]MBW4717113.1 DUF4132 domain-containing protein [Saccharothrix obliqua]
MGARETTAQSEEDKLVLPPRWRQTVHVRAGGRTASNARPAPRSAGHVRNALADDDEARAILHDTEPGLAEVVAEYLAGAPEPFGAAGAAVVLAHLRRSHVDAPVADAWTAEHGLPFAARATAALGRVRLHWADTRPHLEFTPPDLLFARNTEPPALERTRALIAAAGAPDEVGEALSAFRDTPGGRIIAAYLLPSRADWVAEALDESRWHGQPWVGWTPLIAALGTAEQFARIAEHPSAQDDVRTPTALRTVVDGIGAAVAPTLARLLDATGPTDRAARKALLETIAVLPTDEAFTLLLDRADNAEVAAHLSRAAGRFPRRALRLLTEARTTDTAERLLLGHAETHPDLVAALPEAARAVVERVRAAHARVPEADPAELPALLVEPPWLAPRRTRQVVHGLRPPTGAGVSWAPGQRADWLATEVFTPDGLDWPEVVRGFHDGTAPEVEVISLFARGPEELARPLLAHWKPRYAWDVESWGRLVAARYELDALPVLLHLAKSSPVAVSGLLGPFTDDRVAHRVADWLVRLKSVCATAIGWLRGHAKAAARYLVPTAVGTPGPARRAAEAALRVIPDEAVAAAREHGPEVVAVVSADLLDALPAKVPTPGRWADPALLPQVLLAGRRRALPRVAVGHVLTMAAMSAPDHVYAGVPVVRELCDPRSLAEFAWALFERWREVGMPAKEGWGLTALGLFGDDDAARSLAALIRVWPGEGGHARAVTGLDVLAAIGTDTALAQLNGIALKAKFKGLRERARQKIAELAAARGLGPEELADRLVPRFGLDDAATLTIDYGTRRFLVGFDEQLKPHVVDETGKRRKDLPKPGAKDDPELAPAEHRRFAGLKKDVRSVAADQIARLEAAMVRGRRWSATEFRELFTGHPLLWHIVRRLVWTTTDGHSFRPAEDRTLADVHDNTYTLPDNAHVGIAHPLHLGHDLPAWAELFADYEILQPFPQLGRPVHHLTATERTAQRLTRFENIPVPTGRVLGLTQRGWVRGAPQDGGVERWITRPLPGGGSVVASLDPGIAVGAVDVLPEQRLSAIWVDARRDGTWHPRGERVFGELDPVTASELIAELTAVTA